MLPFSIKLSKESIMKKTTFIFSALLTTNILMGYQDWDLDGVEDSIDLCPNTPFDALVDAYGCSQTERVKNPSKLTLSVGTTIRTDEIYDDDNSLSLYLNYRYNQWDFSISNIQSFNQSDYLQDYSSSNNDFYLSAGYTIYRTSTAVRVGIGSKIADNSDTSQTSRKGKYAQNYTVDNSRDNDYYASVNIINYISKRQDIFLFGRYTISGDSETYDYEDYPSLSIGTGYQFTRNFYSALSYNYTGSIYKDSEAEESIAWFNSYNITQSFFVTASYSYALKDFSYDNTLSMSLGVRF